MKVIAEVGSNWKTIDDCLKSIELARKSHAHAVKFQLFTGYELYGPSVDLSTFAHIGQTPYMYRDWIPILARKSQECEIEFMCTAFSVDGYEYIDEFVETHKIASAEMTDINIISKVNSFKKPVFLSTGGSDIEEILKEVGTSTLTNKICVRTLEKIKSNQTFDKDYKQVLHFCAWLISTMDQFKDKHPQEVEDWIVAEVKAMKEKNAQHEREFRNEVKTI